MARNGIYLARAREQIAREAADGVEHVERAVEAALFLVGHVALRGGDADGVARHAQNAV